MKKIEEKIISKIKKNVTLKSKNATMGQTVLKK